MSQSSKPNYNPIFERFVDPSLSEADQLSGIIAYGFYKIAKREWAADIWEQEQRLPSREELDGYIRTWTESRLRGVREQADNVLGTFASTVVEAATPEIREAAIQERVEVALVNFRRAQEGRRGEAILLSMAANLIYTLILIAVVLALAWNGVDLVGLLQKVRPPT